MNKPQTILLTVRYADETIEHFKDVYLIGGYLFNDLLFLDIMTADNKDIEIKNVKRFSIL